MTRLFIAEKPSVAKALSGELGNPVRKDGYIECDKGIVTFCIGHLLENAPPDEYLPADVPVTSKGKKVWRIEDLPIIPDRWILQPKKETRKQLNTIGKLLRLRHITEIVNAGDPDREGQLLVDQVLEHFKCTKPCLRFWVSAQDSTSLRRGLNSLKPNSEYKGWSDAALARGYADWLVGMNYSRAYTLAADRGGKRALLVVGRVQTPTLNLVVERDRLIENFVSLPFFKIDVTIFHPNGEYAAHWKSTVEHDGVDAEGRIIDVNLAQEIVASVKQCSGIVSDYQSETKKQAAPIPFSLAELTMLASKLHGMTADGVLKTAQSLYEKHSLITYPRTDTGYLPESQYSDAKTILQTIGSNIPTLAGIIGDADITIKSKAWSNKRVTAHHGIICTAQRASTKVLSASENILYEMIARRYIAQFYPMHEYQDTKIETTINDELFITNGKNVIKPGWRIVLSGGSEQVESDLPIVVKGDAIKCTDAKMKDAKTSPPKSYTEGTLIYAMENIHRLYAGSKDDKDALKTTDGLGTSATRASIITELKRRKYLTPKGKSIVSTEHGRSVVDAYPDSIKSPYMTAINERILKAIEQSGKGLEKFLEDQRCAIREHVESVNKSQIVVSSTPEKARKNRKTPKNMASSKTSTAHPCGDCGSGLVRRKSRAKGSDFWGCSRFPACKKTYSDNSGKPAI